VEFGFEVENIKCNGCVRSIERVLGELPRVQRVAVDVAEGRVSVVAESDVRAPVREALARLGYPERGSASGLGAVGAKAKSFVSCAIGRFSE
jgi:copper chaperone